MKKSYKTDAIVIRARDLSENDRIITFLSPSAGKFDAVRKGAKKITSRSIGNFEPFNRINLYIAVGKSLDVVVQSKLLDTFPDIRKSLEKTTSAIYMLDLVNRYVDKREENFSLYSLLLSCLHFLESGCDPDVVCRLFEIRFVSIMGYMPEVEKCVVCTGQGDHPYFEYSLGGVVCEKCRSQLKEAQGRSILPGSLQSIRFLMTRPLKSTTRFSIHPMVKNEIKEVMRRYIIFNMPGSEVNTGCYEKLK
ncbi:MAG: DNA repair protein RecO [Candidatus Eremiobacteraeota bacterium]|nr:DNA repair protein RecO [Candidatus Eremiobacteraeota bacterium]